MASPLQTLSVQRKLLYFGLILALFTVSILLKNNFVFAEPDPNNPLDTRPAAPAWTVTGNANALQLRELNQGEARLDGSAIRLLMTGSRGFTISALWYWAADKRKRHEWNDLELIVKSITKLQPYFLTPWLYQSWDL